MRLCQKCEEKITHARYGKYDLYLCQECYEELERQELFKRAEKTKQASDFENWTGKDMVSLFFETYGRYIKEPTESDWKIIMRLWHWGCHADHALSKTITYTLKWAKTSIHQECMRWNKKEK